ncbi:MAG: 3'(2'),5'-bisphosphate nucleotidase CysQ [Chitinophagales bacterium]|nr:3'(2'),5'-bisphosphate nucleotidase CysQ [Chitinophagales bacterium]
MTYNDIEIQKLIDIALNAGTAIMEVYQRNFSVETKDDKSPLTEADRKSNDVILNGLKQHYPSIPFISEEVKQMPYSERKSWTRLWLIDPLDGTKEFIKKNGEFTVNIALIENGVPVLGVVYAPAFDKGYVGIKGEGSFSFSSSDTELKSIHAGLHYSQLNTVKVVGSRSHLSEETVQFVDNLKAQGKEVDFVSSGSSLKICLVAEGKADVYPRFGPTMEWDTAAAHTVALYAGKNVLQYPENTPLVYNKENLLNPWFIVE